MNILRLFKAPAQPRVHDPEEFFRTDHLKTDLKGRTVRGGAVVAATQVYKQVLAVISAVILARLLGPENNGLVAMVTAITGLIESFSDLGLSAATVRQEQLTQKQVSTLFWINMALSLLLGLITAALAPLIASFYGEPRLTLITLAIATTFVFEGLTIQHRALLRRQMRFNSISIIQILSHSIGLVVGISAALAGFDYWSLLLMQLSRIPIEIISTWYLCRWRPGRPGRLDEVRPMLAFGGNLTGFRLVNYIARNLDNLLIGRFYGPAQLGLYTKAYGLLLLPIQRVNTPIATVSYPALARLLDSPSRYRQTYTRIVTTLCLVTMPFVAFMIASSDWVVVTLLGPRWIESARMFAWLGVSGLIEPFSSTAVWLFSSQGRGREQFHWGIISTIIIIGSIIIGLPWGPVGVAASYGLAGLFIRTPVLFWMAGRTGPVSIKDLYLGIAPLICVCCAILLSLLAFRIWGAGANILINLIVAAGITVIVTLVVLIMLPSGRTALKDLRTLPASLLKRG